MNISNKKLVFVTGKGGVGKSVCAASLAWREAQGGRKVCLVELGNQSYYESFFETRGISYEPSEVVSGVHIALLSPEACLKEYVLHFLKVPKLYDILFQNKVMKAFMNAAPAVSELSILGKLTSIIRGILKDDYDVFIVDCYSTGHALALLRAPKGMGALLRAGPLGDQARDMHDILQDPALTHYVLVTLPEEMPVTETEEFHKILKDEFNAEITLVCNKLLAPPISVADEKQLSTQVKDKNMQEFLSFLEFKEKTQTTQLSRLQKMGKELYAVPLILDAHRGQEYVEKIAPHLEKAWTSPSS